MCSKSRSRLVTLKEKWWFDVDNKKEHCPDPIMIGKRLSRMAFVHEGS